MVRFEAEKLLFLVTAHNTTDNIEECTLGIVHNRGRKLPIAIEDFYYVDKTGMIAECLNASEREGDGKMDAIEQNLFSNTPSVTSKRCIYTPSAWAKTTLLYLQEAGTLQAVKPHTSTRSNLRSFLCFVVTSGSGTLSYEKRTYELKTGDCVFIDCLKPYSHSTGKELWTLSWCHFYGAFLPAVYAKYQERGGQPVFSSGRGDSVLSCPSQTGLEDSLLFVNPITTLIDQLYHLALSADYIRDMHINEKLNSLLSILMEHSWHPEKVRPGRKRLEMERLKDYLDNSYTERIVLDDLVGRFYMDKSYMSRIFKEAYGVTIISYVEQKRITKAKSLLRFTDMTIDEIGNAVGLSDANYFSRRFRKIEGMSPREYRKMW